MQPVLTLEKPVRIFSTASVVGKEEHLGRFGACFDHYDETGKFNQKTWELAEAELSRQALSLALEKALLSPEDLDLICAGDLQNQCVSSVHGLHDFAVPYLGLYGACSTATESLLVASLALNASENIRRVGAVTTSHNAAAERQFRLPLAYGGQRTPSAQYTATAGGAFLLDTDPENKRNCPLITHIMPGVIVESGICDPSNMGAGMAPSAADSLVHFFKESPFSVADFDAIITGDLGKEGTALMLDICKKHHLDIEDVHTDCGMMLYDEARQDCHAGASGCGCSAVLLASHFYPRLCRGELHRILFMSTGALMSPSSLQQGKSIFGIAPCVVIEESRK